MNDKKLVDCELDRFFYLDQNINEQKKMKDRAIKNVDSKIARRSVMEVGHLSTISPNPNALKDKFISTKMSLTYAHIISFVVGLGVPKGSLELFR